MQVDERIQRIAMSWEDYLERHDLERAEWASGVAIVSPPPRQRHGVVQVNLAALLKDSLPQMVVMVESGLRTASSLRGPDVMVVERLTGTTWVEEAPVLVAEVLSPTTRSEDLLRKGPEYAAAGARQYWVLDPDERSLEVYRLDAGRWEPLVAFDESHPTGEVVIGDDAVVSVDLGTLLAG